MVNVPQRAKDSWPYRAARAAYYLRQSEEWRRIRLGLRGQSRAIAHYLASTARPRLQIGSGMNPINGWLNADYYPDDPKQIHIDARKRFPLPDNSIELIYSEHMIEHIPLDYAVTMFRECLRVLKPGGRIRISTPDLQSLIAIYRDPENAYHRYHFSAWLPDARVKTPAVSFNDFVRNWGHVMIYDEETLRAAMPGFTKFQRVPLQGSVEPLLQGLANDKRMAEGMLDEQTITIEAVKP